MSSKNGNLESAQEEQGFSESAIALFEEAEENERIKRAAKCSSSCT